MIDLKLVVETVQKVRNAQDMETASAPVVTILEDCARMELQLRQAQALIVVAVELGDIDPHGENPRCPQDDTCSCSVAKSINKALDGYKPTAANLRKIR
jgi:hypothetical protein